MQLHASAVAAGHRLLAYDTLGSTNEEALSLARNAVLAGEPARGEKAPLWLTARAQSRGRGRGGRTWASPPGNLYATLLLNDPAPHRYAPELSFVAALAVHDAILGCAPALSSRLALKWPNDVLCGGAKVAGILIEGTQLSLTLSVAAGVGVNCVSHPAETAYPATDLKAAGAEVSAEQLFLALSAAMLRRLEQWARGESFAAIRSDWRERAGGVGEEIRVRLPDRELTGRFEELDDVGHLLLRLPDGKLQTITAGDVFPLATGERSRRLMAQDKWPDGTE